ncbi:MAG: hypothetical protein V7637_3481 [Mycobacteriales bacterium]|jgi:hypothetical protein
MDILNGPRRLAAEGLRYGAEPDRSAASAACRRGAACRRLPGVGYGIEPPAVISAWRSLRRAGGVAGVWS